MRVHGKLPTSIKAMLKEFYRLYNFLNHREVLPVMGMGLSSDAFIPLSSYLTCSNEAYFVTKPAIGEKIILFRTAFDEIYSEMSVQYSKLLLLTVQ